MLITSIPPARSIFAAAIAFEGSSPTGGFTSTETANFFCAISRWPFCTASLNDAFFFCSAAWAAGHVGRGPTPLLAACVAPTGVAAVFPSAPGANVCEQLGLSILPIAGGAATIPGPATTEPAVFLQVRDAIVQSLLNACLDQATAAATVEKILSRSGLAWTVTVPTPFPSNRPCASPAFDESRRQVILVGIPRVG